MSQASFSWRRFIPLVALVLLVACQLIDVDARPAQGQTYYVDPGGSDLDGDGSAGNPWANIQHAAAQVAAGDTVLVNPGTYTGGITVDTDGTDSEPITFQANGTGVVIEGSGRERDAFFINGYGNRPDGIAYIVVDGFTIQNADRAGLRISWAHHVTVRDCTFADNYRWGVFTDFSDYTTVENCESYGAEDEHGIYISNSSDHPAIRGNRLHHNNGCGLHMNGDLSMGGDGIISHALVEDNVIYENGAGGGSGINMDGVTHSIIRNNLLYDNHASGLSMYQIDGGSGSHDNRVLNNTIIMASDGRWAVNIPESYSGNPNNSPSSYNELFNNIIYNNHSWRGIIFVAPSAQAGFQSDYNVVMDRFSATHDGEVISLVDWQALGYDAHSIIATPAELFVDVAADDYHLKPGSPAIDLGTPLGDVTDDLEGNPRPVGSTHDAGAYEYQVGGGNSAPHVPSNPSPADGATDVLTSQALTWQGGDPDGDVVTYTVAFGTANPPPTAATVTQTLYVASVVTDTTYYWQVTATDGLSTTVGPLWQFTTLPGEEEQVYLPLATRQWQGTAPSGDGPQIAGCQVFPSDHIWNVPVDTLPLDANSAAYINTIGASTYLRPDFGSGTWEGFPIGIPYVVVPGTQAKSSVTFQYDAESDDGPYPIPPNPPIEGDPDGSGDRHILIVDRDNCVLYELFAAHLESDGWYAGSGAIFDLDSYALRPDGWTSADAAGLPILPGLVRYDEVASGEIKHAIRFTAPQTRRAYVWPARHYASSLTGSQYPPMGQRFRLKADFNMSGFSPEVQVILQAMKTYGIILADNGSSWFISGAPDERWDNDVLRELRQVHGSDFEAVDVSSLMIDQNSGQTP